MKKFLLLITMVLSTNIFASSGAGCTVDSYGGVTYTCNGQSYYEGNGAKCDAKAAASYCKELIGPKVNETYQYSSYSNPLARKTQRHSKKHGMRDPRWRDPKGALWHI